MVKPHLIQIKVSGRWLQRVETWREKQGVKTRSEAIRLLVDRGLGRRAPGMLKLDRLQELIDQLENIVEGPYLGGQVEIPASAGDAGRSTMDRDVPVEPELGVPEPDFALPTCVEKIDTEEVKTVIAAFDAVRDRVFGLTRQWPTPSDIESAERLIQHGHTPASAEELFETRCRLMKAGGMAPPPNIDALFPQKQHEIDPDAEIAAK